MESSMSACGDLKTEYIQRNVSYKREKGRNYILFHGRGDWSGQLEMIRRNRIPGLAGFYTEWEDHDRYYGYDITGAQPLVRLLEVRSVTKEETKQLIGQLAVLLEKLDSYLLDRDKVILKPEFLYWYQEPQKPRFFFCEEQEGNFGEHLKELILFLLERSDREDRQLTELLFRLFGICGREEPEPEQLLNCFRESSGIREEKISQTSDPPDAAKECPMAEKKENPGKRSGRVKSFWGKLFRRRRVVTEEWWDDLEPEPSRSLEPEELRWSSRGKEETSSTQILYVEEDIVSIPVLTSVPGGEPIRLEKFPFYIGTQADMDYRPEFYGVSRMHLKLDHADGCYWITDLNSTNGTRLNEKPLRPNEKCRLAHGDRLWIAGLIYEFREFGHDKMEHRRKEPFDMGAESW